MVVVFAGAHPQDVGVFGIQGETADALGSVAVKNRLVSGSAVGGFPNTAVGRRDVVLGFVQGIHRDVNDSAAGGCWTDHTEIHLT